MTIYEFVEWKKLDDEEKAIYEQAREDGVCLDLFDLCRLDSIDRRKKELSAVRG